MCPQKGMNGLHGGHRPLRMPPRHPFNPDNEHLVRHYPLHILHFFEYEWKDYKKTKLTCRSAKATAKQYACLGMKCPLVCPSSMRAVQILYASVVFWPTAKQYINWLRRVLHLKTSSPYKYKYEDINKIYLIWSKCYQFIAGTKCQCQCVFIKWYTLVPHGS